MNLDEIEHGKVPKDIDYEKELQDLQIQLLYIQQAYVRQNRRAIIIFEGSDAAGKGGNIRRLTERMDARNLRVHNIAAPEKLEQSIHFLYRFWKLAPPPGRIDIFDRSWYGRVLVERIEGFCSEDAWRRGFQRINEYEETLAEEGTRIVKIYLHITKAEQLKRFKSRFDNPHKCWKLTEEDFRNRDKWDEHIAATTDMIKYCSNKAAPWTVIGANSKKATRLEVLKSVAAQLSKKVDVSPPEIDPKVKKLALKAFEEL